MKGRFVVRIVLFRGINQDNKIMGTPFLECLRRCGYVVIHRDDENGMCFDLLCPYISGQIRDTKVWAEQNAERMQTFGFNAVVAPEMP